jgi:hypothetical protein
VEDPTFFDSRCTRFLGVDYDELKKRTLEGGSDEEILDWCFERGRKPGEEEIEIWNAFLAKRGWRDEGSADLVEAKKRTGWQNRMTFKPGLTCMMPRKGERPVARLAESLSGAPPTLSPTNHACFAVCAARDDTSGAN